MKNISKTLVDEIKKSAEKCLSIDFSQDTIIGKEDFISILDFLEKVCIADGDSLFGSQTPHINTLLLQTITTCKVVPKIKKEIKKQS